MYITFWLLIIFGAVLLWFLLAALYQPIGRLIKMIVTKSINAINKKDFEHNKY